MKRVTIYLVLAALSVVSVQASTASAKNQKYSGRNQSTPQNRQVYTQKKATSVPTAVTQPKPTSIAHSNKDKNKDKDKDNDKCHPKQPPLHCGTGQPGTIVDPVRPMPPTPVSSGGFVWVNGHWERPRAGQSTIIDPTLVGPVVRDHRTPTYPPLSSGNGSGGVVVTSGTGTIVRDHRTATATPYNPSFGAIVRDHRGATTTTTGLPTVRDHRGNPSLGSGLGSVVTTIGGDVAGAGKSVGQAAGVLGGEVLGVGREIGSGVGTLGREAGQVGSTFGRGAGQVAGTVGSGVSAVGRGVERAGSAVANAAESAVDAVGDFLGF